MTGQREAGLLPSEPSPGVYRDAEGIVFVHAADGWLIAGLLGEAEWPVARGCATFPLVPLFSVDELIPDPDDPEALRQLYEVHGELLPTWDEARELCRALRERAGSRQTEGGNDRG